MGIPGFLGLLHDKETKHSPVTTIPNDHNSHVDISSMFFAYLVAKFFWYLSSDASCLGKQLARNEAQATPLPTNIKQLEITDFGNYIPASAATTPSDHLADSTEALAVLTNLMNIKAQCNHVAEALHKKLEALELDKTKTLLHFDGDITVQKHHEHLKHHKTSLDNLIKLQNLVEQQLIGAKSAIPATIKKAKQCTHIPKHSMVIIHQELANKGWTTCPCDHEADVCISAKYLPNDRKLSQEKLLLLGILCQNDYNIHVDCMGPVSNLKFVHDYKGKLSDFQGYHATVEKYLKDFKKPANQWNDFVHAVDIFVSHKQTGESSEDGGLEEADQIQPLEQAQNYNVFYGMVIIEKKKQLQHLPSYTRYKSPDNGYNQQYTPQYIDLSKPRTPVTNPPKKKRKKTTQRKKSTTTKSKHALSTEKKVFSPGKGPDLRGTNKKYKDLLKKTFATKILPVGCIKANLHWTKQFDANPNNPEINSIASAINKFICSLNNIRHYMLQGIYLYISQIIDCLMNVTPATSVDDITNWFSCLNAIQDSKCCTGICSVLSILLIHERRK
ncbi:hypothetical protein BGZ74_002137, partial [Mortierella antarctica]